MQLTDSSELTIASGAISVTANFYRVDTESDAASDDLDTITAGTGVADGHVLVLRAENTARTVMVKHNTGNIVCNGNADIVMDASHHTAELIYDGNLTKWLAYAGPQSHIYRRQGGSATDWDTTGTNSYQPLVPRFQVGAVVTAGVVTSLSTVSVTVTFPVAFTALPLVLLTSANNSGHLVTVSRADTTTTTVKIVFRDTLSAGVVGVAYWLAIGE